MPKNDQYDVRVQLLETLLQKLEDDRYPSTTTLDMIEELLAPDEVPVYAEVLLNRIRSDAFPSVPMMARLKNLA
jgi:hypothetical protein